MKDRHRIFIAVNLPQDIKKILSDYQKKWQDIPAKWTSLNNLHITLVFLGEITDEELGEVCMVVKQIAEDSESFNIKLNKISYGPIGKVPPRYIWAGGEKSKELSLIKNNLENLLIEKVRFAVDKKSFAPHITLARIQEWQWRAIEPEERPKAEENIDLDFTVESIEVVESVLRKEGPQYEVIESHNLK